MSRSIFVCKLKMAKIQPIILAETKCSDVTTTIIQYLSHAMVFPMYNLHVYFMQRNPLTIFNDVIKANTKNQFITLYGISGVLEEIADKNYTVYQQTEILFTKQPHISEGSIFLVNKNCVLLKTMTNSVMIIPKKTKVQKVKELLNITKIVLIYDKRKIFDQYSDDNMCIAELIGNKNDNTSMIYCLTILRGT
eukprot:302972_1